MGENNVKVRGARQNIGGSNSPLPTLSLGVLKDSHCLFVLIITVVKALNCCLVKGERASVVALHSK